MTENGERSIIDALHAVELRVIERLSRVETKLERIRDVEKRANKNTDRINKLTVGFVVVALIALGDAGIKFFTLI